MGIIRNKSFLVGIVVGTVVGPMVLAKVAPSLKHKLPTQS